MCRAISHPVADPEELNGGSGQMKNGCHTDCIVWNVYNMYVFSWGRDLQALALRHRLRSGIMNPFSAYNTCTHHNTIALQWQYRPRVKPIFVKMYLDISTQRPWPLKPEIPSDTCSSHISQGG